MKSSELEPAYEAARTWALQILRSGIAPWMRERHPPVPSPSLQPARLSVSPLLTIVAAMIAEVGQ